jgi:hypothetical protein
LKLSAARANRDAIGARVWLEADGPRQAADVRSGGSYLSHNDMRVHFGLGGRTSVPPVVVRWPNGDTERFGGLAANHIHILRQGQGQPHAR